MSSDSAKNGSIGREGGEGRGQFAQSHVRLFVGAVPLFLFPVGQDPFRPMHLRFVFFVRRFSCSFFCQSACGSTI